MPAGQSRSGDGGATVYWTPNPDCTGYISGLSVYTEVVGAWTRVDGFHTAASGAQGAKLYVKVFKAEAGGSLQAHLDDVRTAPVVFRDGFELGGLGGWSSSVP